MADARGGLQGAHGGAATGFSVGGPLGALIGGVGGGLLGLFGGGKKRRREADSNMPYGLATALAALAFLASRKRLPC